MRLRTDGHSNCMRGPASGEAEAEEERAEAGAATGALK